MFQQTAQNAKANVLEAENKDKQLLGASTLRLHENKNLIRKLNTEKGVQENYDRSGKLEKNSSAIPLNEGEQKQIKCGT